MILLATTTALPSIGPTGLGGDTSLGLSSPEAVVGVATLLVALVTLIFTLFFYVVFVRLSEVRAELRDERKGLKQLKQDLEGQVAAVFADLQAQKADLASNRRFLVFVWDQYSELLVGIVAKLESVLRPRELQEVRLSIAEAESALNLFNPEQEAVLAALSRLEAIGTELAVPALRALVDDEAGDCKVRLRAQKVLHLIRGRLPKGPHLSPDHHSKSGESVESGP